MPKEINDQELRALIHSVSQSVVCIVGKDSAGQFGTMIGTGTLVDIGGQNHVLTAAHVLEGCNNEELRFFLPDKAASLTEPPLPTAIDMAGFSLWQPLAIESRLQNDRLDVALLKLRGADETMPEFCCFHRLRETPHPPTETFQFVMMGFPSQRAGKLPSGNRVALRNVDYPELADHSGKTFSDFDAAVHFLTDFPSADKFHPGGYSGSGLWLHQISDEFLWRPEPIYCGMQVGYYKRPKLLKIVTVNAILAFIESETVSA